MPQLIWSPEALADVQRLYRFFAEKNPVAARRAVSAICGGMQIGADHPDGSRPGIAQAPNHRGKRKGIEVWETLWRAKNEKTGIVGNRVNAGELEF